ncbi:MAG: glycosyltransferase, partial [Caulobacteraceae bacterium]
MLETPPGAAPVDGDLAAVRAALSAAGAVSFLARVEAHIAAPRGNPNAAMRLLDLLAVDGWRSGDLGLIEVFARRFEDDERFVDVELRCQLALGQRLDLVAKVERLLDGEANHAPLAYRMVISLNRAAAAGEEVGEGLLHRAAVRFLVAADRSPERGLWLGRYYRDIGNTMVALKEYMAAWEQAPADGRLRAVTLREAADTALSGDQWGRDAPVLLRARQAQVPSTWPWRAAAVSEALDYVGAGALLDPHANLPGTQTYSRLYSMIGTPEIAFDYLLDETLARRAPYQPKDGLLMVGTSLAGGGMERIFANSYRAVSRAGVFERVRMALLNFEPETASAFYLTESGAAAGDIAVLSGRTAPEFPASLLPIGLGRRVSDAYRLVLRERPRVIHAWNDLPGIVAAFAGLWAGCPKIFVHFHHMRAINLSNDRNLVRSYPHCYRRLLERQEIELLFVADASADDYADWWSLTRSAKFRRLFNGFAEPPGGIPRREDARRALGLPLDVPVLGTVFRFHAVKRPLLWIEAARAVHAELPNAVFVMVGDGALLGEARARVSALGLEASFRFPGQVKNVPDYLACFDLFMLTSRREGLPNSLVEAQLAGVPVLSTDVGGARETFLPGVTGRLAPGDSAEALGAAAIDCLTDHA